MLRGLMLTLLLAPAVRAAETDWLPLLTRLGITSADLSVRPQRWETRMSDADVERLLSDPLAAPETLARWERALAPGADLLAAAAAALPRAGGKAPPTPDDDLSCDALPPGLDKPLSALSGQLAVIARETRAVIPPANARAALEKGLSGLLRGGAPNALDAAVFTQAERFDAGRFAALAADADAAVRAALPSLRAALADAPDRKIRCGDLLVGSSGDDEYSEAELSALLLVEPGGRNRYFGPAAAAGAGQVRVVVDLGRDAVFESTGPAAGSGRFGVGLLYALGEGETTIDAGDFSAGAGFFGVGAAFVSGAARLRTGAFSQGAGAFGAGALELGGPARADARFAAQGFGFTRGVGLFAARGKLDARCGLSIPDSREELAWLSMCQGVGYGPRAFAGGGWGVARVDGAGSRLESSYFSQGSGYWHAAGLLSVFGAGTTLQSRRYSQGTGVHTALGALRIRAHGVKTVNWGVGPGYGWDYGVGVLDAEGDGLSLQNDWSGGRADANGRAFVRVSGANASLAVHGLSYGSYARALGGWALVALSGSGHRLRAPGLAAPLATPLLAQTPYGLILGELTLDPALGVSTTTIWPNGERSSLAESRKRELEQGLKFSRATPAEATALVGALEPERFDEHLWLRLFCASLGRHCARAALKAAEGETGLRRALLSGFLRSAPLAQALEPALAELKNPDWRARREGAGILAALLDLGRGEEPGRLAFLQDTLTYLADGDEAAFVKKCAVKRLSDLYSALALADRLPLADRMSLLEAATSPFDAVGEAALKKYAALAKASADAVKKAFAAELDAAAQAAPRARQALRAAAQDPDQDVAAAALVALGALGDAQPLGAALGSASAGLRLAAAAGAARAGPSAAASLERALTAADPRLRAVALTSAGRSWDGELLARSLRRALSDPDEGVRLAALAAITTIQTPELDRRKDFRPALETLLNNGTPPERAAAAARLAEIPK